MAELCKQFEVHPTQITDWNQQLLEHAADAIGGGADKVDLAPLHAKIGPLITWKFAGHLQAANNRHTLRKP